MTKHSNKKPQSSPARGEGAQAGGSVKVILQRP